MVRVAPLSISALSTTSASRSEASAAGLRADVRGFAELDERVVRAQPGVVVVRAALDAQDAIASHVSRRLRTSGWVPLDARAARTGAALFREVATLLGVGLLPTEPEACADAIAAAALARRAAIVAPFPADGSWDAAVASALLRSAPDVLVVYFTVEPSSPGAMTASWEGQVFDVPAELGASDKLRWLGAVAEEAHADLPATDLRSLETWWTRARRIAPDATPADKDLSAASRELLTCIALAGRSLPIASLASLSAPVPTPESLQASIDELVLAGLVSAALGRASASTSGELSSLEAIAPPETRLAVASLLSGERGGFDPDPWAHARAAELYVGAGAFERADAAISSALRSGIDAQVSGEIALRWFEVVRRVDGEGGLGLRVKAAKRALLLGEAGEALRWCESAAALDANDPTICLLMGRALVQLGDLVAARVCLAKAEAAAASRGEPDAELLARVAVERAEVCYVAGDLETATEHANRAALLTHVASTRLAARGTLGKILLARGSWDLADEHFADDALVASSSGETTAELRARLNRAIALLSKGSLDEARALLVRVLDDGTRLHEERARAYALSNLGLVAYRQHDYGSALHYWEQTIRFPQALRGRLSTALTIGNLADLRLRLGLVDHAEHAIAFGRRLLAGSAPPRCAALFKWVSAQIALARRNTELARREIEGALVDAQTSGDRAYLESAYVVAARVALEDGDLVRAADVLSHAEAIAKSPRARAEVAIVRAAHLRASGQPAIVCATEALQVARESGEEDLLFEIHALLMLLHRDAGEREAAQAHGFRAIAVRDQVASGLPPDIRAAFLAKPDVILVSRLQASLALDLPGDGRPLASSGRREDDAEETVVPRGSLRSTPHPREMVGDDPQIKSLAVAIKKVATSNSTVLIRGESGTGKELVAEALHRASNRAAGPLVSVNCAALVETLLLSELFGHEKGAFTGASTRRRGRFEMAEGGTLFLDEIGDISPRTQVALLRVLQEKTFERVGGATPIRANVRVVCATHRDLRAMVERGDFREDLYYRLRGITLEVPALRARIGDLPKIAEHLLGRIAVERDEAPKELSADALDLFARHRWPGNIRELENVLRAAVLFAEGHVITQGDIIDNVDDLRSVAQSRPGSQPPISRRSSNLLPAAPISAPFSSERASERLHDEGRFSGTIEDESEAALPEDEANATSIAYAQVRQGAVSLADIKRQIERDCIARALLETNGNITRAAALLGMKRPRLSQLVKQYGLSAAACSEGTQ